MRQQLFHPACPSQSTARAYGLGEYFNWVRFISVGKRATLPQVAIFNTKTLGF